MYFLKRSVSQENKERAHEWSRQKKELTSGGYI